VEEHPSSIASLVLIQDYLLRNNNPGTIGNYLNLIESPAKEDKLFHRLHSAYQRALLTSVGSKAPDFAVNAINGDSLTLDSFHGRHLILAFEKPGSEACNEDHPVLDDLYKKYDRKKVEILSLVFDENPDDREKIAEEHKINWLQAIDTLGLASSSIFAYNISILPDYFLIDEEGVIRASHIPVKEIQILLEEKIESGK
jgi:peroxiredoxin